MPTPTIQTLVTDAQQVLNLDSISAVRSVVAVALANANTGTPLNPNLTTQQLWNEFYQVVTKPKSDIESIIANQLMKFLYAPPAPGGVGANKQVIFNDGGALAGAANLYWDKVNNRVGVGTASPSTTFHTNSDGVVSGAGWTAIGRFNNVLQTKGIDLGYNPGNNNAVLTALSGGATSGFEFWTFDGGWASRANLNSSGLGIFTAPASGNSSGLTVGTIGASRNIAVSMFGSYARLREWDSTNTFALVTNMNVDNGIDNNALPSWKVQFGAGIDQFRIQRAPAASTSFTTLATVNPSGDINLIGNLVPTNGKGIDFSATPQPAGMTSELLSDYEEGTWTPTMTFATPGTLSINYSIRQGNYTKVGNLVTARFNIQISPGQFTKGTASGTFIIGGLPFNIGSSGLYYFDLAASLADQSAGSLVLGNVVGGTNQIYYEGVSVSGTRILRDYAAITAANFAATNAGFISIAAVIQYTV